MLTVDFYIVMSFSNRGVSRLETINDLPVSLTFSGNTIFKAHNFHEELFGRVLLAQMNGMRHLFIAVRPNSLFCLDGLPIESIQNLIENYDMIKNIKSFKMIQSFSDL